MPSDALLIAAVSEAKRHSIDPSIVCGMIQRESSWFRWANKYEPGFRWLWRPGGKLPRHGGSKLTEIHNQKTSWGLMQIMGGTARWLGFDGLFLTELLLPEQSLRFGCMYLKRQIGRFGIEGGISAYNAGTETQDNYESYVLPVLRSAEEWKVDVERITASD